MVSRRNSAQYVQYKKFEWLTKALTTPDGMQRSQNLNVDVDDDDVDLDVDIDNFDQQAQNVDQQVRFI